MEKRGILLRDETIFSLGDPFSTNPHPGTSFKDKQETVLDFLKTMLFIVVNIYNTNFITLTVL